MQFSTSFVKCSKKEHKCMLCSNTIPAGSPYVRSPYTESGSVADARICVECAYLLHFTTKGVREGNFSDSNIPNFLRKIRNEYRKDPKGAWDNIEKIN